MYCHFSAGPSGGLLKHENTVVHVDPNAPQPVKTGTNVVPVVNNNNNASALPPTTTPLNTEVNYANHIVPTVAAVASQQRGHTHAPNISGELPKNNS